MSLQQPRLHGDAPELLLFDLDGTLVDSVPDLADAVDQMLIQLQLTPAGEDRVRRWVGNGASMLVRRALAWALQEASAEAVGQIWFQRAHPLFLDAYQACFCNRTQVYPDVREMLLEWQQQNFKMAVVTNKPERFVAPLLEHFQIRHYFSLLVGGDSLPSKKPDPLPLLHSCEQLQANPQRSLMVGDSRSDVEAARAAGMPVVCVSYGYNHGEPVAHCGPDRVIDSLKALL